MKGITVKGVLLGERISSDKKVIGSVVHVIKDQYSNGNGPAENAYIYVDSEDSTNLPKARYISWINLYDIENAEKHDDDRWILVEPRESFKQKLNWMPYGWGAPHLPSVADS